AETTARGRDDDSVGHRSSRAATGAGQRGASGQAAEMSRDALLRRLYRGPRGGTLANPYRHEHADLERPGASQDRRRNLEAYLEAVGRPRLVLVGEAMGYRGARFSGIAFTSERQLAGAPHQCLPWARGVTRATSLRPALWAEPSGTIVWRAL